MHSLQVIVVIFIAIHEIAGDLYAGSFPYVIESSVKKSNGNSNLDGYSRKQDQDRAKYMSDIVDYTKLYNKDSASKGHDVIHVETGNADSSDRHVVGQDQESDKSHNRKKVKSGFHNTYSKDEQGSNSSYYEDSDDRAGNVSYEKRHGTTNDDHDRKYLDGLRDGSLKDRSDDRVSQYNANGGNSRHQFAERDDGNQQRESSANDQYSGYQRLPGHYHSDRYGISDRISDYDLYRRPAYRRQDIDLKPLFNPSEYTNNYRYYSTTADDLPLSHPLPYNRSPVQDDFLRHKIRIYDDPRELPADTKYRSRPNERRQELASSYSAIAGEDISRIYHAPRLDSRPSSFRLRDYRPLSYSEQRDSLNYRDYY